MDKMVQPIMGSFRFTQNTMFLAAYDLKNEDAVYRTRGGEGASISWVVGHLCAFRYYIMDLLGESRPNPFEELFGGRSSASDGAGYPTISELLESWNDIHSQLEGVLANVTEERLTNPPSDSPHGEKAILDTLLFYMWHEAYHMGQLGTIRTELGYKSISELAMEAAAKGKK